MRTEKTYDEGGLASVLTARTDRDYVRTRTQKSPQSPVRLMKEPAPSPSLPLVVEKDYRSVQSKWCSSTTEITREGMVRVSILPTLQTNRASFEAVISRVPKATFRRNPYRPYSYEERSPKFRRSYRWFFSQVFTYSLFHVVSSQEPSNHRGCQSIT